MEQFSEANVFVTLDINPQDKSMVKSIDDATNAASVKK